MGEWNLTDYPTLGQQRPLTAQERLMKVEGKLELLLTLVEKAERHNEEQYKKLERLVEKSSEENRRLISQVEASRRQDALAIRAELKESFNMLQETADELKEASIKQTRVTDILALKLGIVFTGLGGAVAWAVNYIADKLK